MRSGKRSSHSAEASVAPQMRGPRVARTYCPAAVWSLVVLLITGCTPTLERRVLEYEGRVNAGRVDAVLELFTQDATVELEGTYSLRGTAALRGLAEWDSVMHTHLTFHEIVTLGDTVLANVVETNDWLSAIGIIELVHPSTIIIYRAGLITHIEATTDTAGAHALGRALDEILTWGLVDRPEEVRKLVSEEGVLYDRENAVLWKELLREWESVRISTP